MRSWRSDLSSRVYLPEYHTPRFRAKRDNAIRTAEHNTADADAKGDCCFLSAGGDVVDVDGRGGGLGGEDVGAGVGEAVGGGAGALEGGDEAGVRLVGVQEDAGVFEEGVVCLGYAGRGGGGEDVGFGEHCCVAASVSASAADGNGAE